ncbi:MAG: aminoglycoside N(3)-acetyltransferase [Anaerolineales bacterium]|nr:aminoglycoside N(3)-acetyltransferase [Anaerolineales bacterium]
MSEADVVQQTPSPRTRSSLASDLHELGLAPGMTVLVHSALSSLGWVCGGSVAVVQALMDVLTPHGTLVMPTHTGDLSEPSYWENPPVPQEWWDEIRETMPAYDPQITPTRMMGDIVETFRVWPGVLRSAHPSSSFAAWGMNAPFVIEYHALDDSLGETSPLARIYDMEGWVLLLGVGYDNNTSFHLAEYRIPDATRIEQGAPIFEDGRRVWKTYQDLDLDADVFPTIGSEYEAQFPIRKGTVGSADSRLFPQREAVDFALRWFSEKRNRDQC